MPRAVCLLIAGLLLSTPSPAQPKKPISGTVRGLHATYNGNLPGTQIHVWVSVWQGPISNGRQGVTLSYDFDTCYLDPCDLRSGYGPIPEEALRIEKDRIILTVDTALLPPPFERRAGAGGPIQIVWKLTPRTSSLPWEASWYWERITGTRRIVEGRTVRHETGPAERWLDFDADGNVFGYQMNFGLAIVETANKVFTIERKP